MELTDETLQSILDSYPTLNLGGFGGYDPTKPYGSSKYDPTSTSGGRNFKFDRIRLIVKYIPYLFSPTSRYTTWSSYGMKHHVEGLLKKHVQHYVSNGELILAMIASGYTPSSTQTLNCFFKVKPLFSNTTRLEDYNRKELMNRIKFMEAIEIQTLS